MPDLSFILFLIMLLKLTLSVENVRVRRRYLGNGKLLFPESYAAGKEVKER